MIIKNVLLYIVFSIRKLVINNIVSYNDVRLFYDNLFTLFYVLFLN